MVINRPGAGGLIAAQAAAALPKDGYSIYMTQASTWTVLPIQQDDKMPVDLHKAFAPVGMVGEQPIAVGVNKDVKANSVAELVQLANKHERRHAVRRHQPRRPSASDRRVDARQGQDKHVVRACRRRGGVDQRRHRRPHPDHVRGPCRHGAGNAGRRHPAPWRRSQKRLPNVPDLPAINETIPGVVSSGWIVMMVPAGVPDAIVQKLNKDLRTVIADKEVIERFQQLGTYSRDLTPQQTDDFIEERRKAVVADRAAGRGEKARSSARSEAHQPPGANAPGGISLGST